MTEEELSWAESGPEDDDLPQWEKDAIATAREVSESEDFLALPDS